MLRLHTHKAAFFDMSNSFGAMPHNRGHERLFFRSDGLKKPLSGAKSLISVLEVKVFLKVFSILSGDWMSALQH